ncbi:MAG TPA: iron-containing redox enzyme family protein [Kofleriaceae bacterium]|nr:iron-containing redox enzyme family protein [Kofleriaceae bacterium]
MFELESRSLDTMLRQHPLLRPMFLRDFRGVSPTMTRQAYLRLLKMSADYVQFTVPALRAAGDALRHGDAEDQAWSAMFLAYAAGETDEAADYGHHIWARDDIKAIDPDSELLHAPVHPHALLYGQYFIADVARHPYAILGAKGVLEHLSIRIADDLVRGIVDSGVANAERGTTFFHHHGVLDIDHVREGDRNLGKLTSARKRTEILEGAYFTSGSYRALIHYNLPT